MVARAKITEKDVVLSGIQARQADVPDWTEELFYTVDDLCEQRGLPEPSDGWSRDPEIKGFHQELGELWCRYDDAHQTAPLSGSPSVS